MIFPVSQIFLSQSYLQMIVVFFYTYNNNIDPSARLNSELNKVVKWLNANKLSLNIKKTNFMIFPPTTKQDGPQLNITINGQKILQVTQTKFMGIIIDSNLTWKAHIKFIRNKVAKSIGIIQKARIILDEDTLIGLYYSCLYPYFSSVITIWGKANKSVLDPLLKLQKKAVRLVFNKPQKTHSLPLSIKANILPLNVIYTSAVYSFMFKVHHNLLPNIITNLFTKRNQSAHKTTR